MTSPATKDTIKSIARQNRVLLVIGAVGVFSLLILNVFLAIRLLPEKYETALGDFPSPMILNRIPGIDGSAVKLGEVTVVRTDRCVNRDTQLTTITIWTPESPTQSIPNSEQFKSPATKGCMTSTLALKMPDKITPGKWHIQGIVRDEPSGDVRYWTSEIFVVVP